MVSESSGNTQALFFFSQIELPGYKPVFKSFCQQIGLQKFSCTNKRQGLVEKQAFKRDQGTSFLKICRRLTRLIFFPTWIYNFI